MWMSRRMQSISRNSVYPKRKQSDELCEKSLVHVLVHLVEEEPVPDTDKEVVDTDDDGEDCPPAVLDVVLDVFGVLVVCEVLERELKVQERTQEKRTEEERTEKLRHKDTKEEDTREEDGKVKTQ